jgi:hypothetical protein
LLVSHCTSMTKEAILNLTLRRAYQPLERPTH